MFDRLTAWTGIGGRRDHDRRFLKSYGLAEYAAGSYESGIDDTAIQASPNGDLEKSGIPHADRKRLLSADAPAYSHRGRLELPAAPSGGI